MQLEVRNRNWWLKSPRTETRYEKSFLITTGMQLKLLLERWLFCYVKTLRNFQ